MDIEEEDQSSSNTVEVEPVEIFNHSIYRKIHQDNVTQYRQKLHDEFKYNVTMHGYKQLATEKGCRRLCWLLVITVVTSFAIYLFFDMLIDYGYKTVLEYEEEEGLTSLNFPTITICRNSPVFAEHTLHRFPIDVTLQEFKLFYKEELSSVSYNYNSSPSSTKILHELYLKNYTSYKSILKLFENTIDDCTDLWKELIAGSVCNLGNEPCNMLGDFKETLHWKYSLCHEWNYYDKHNTSKIQTSIDQRLTLLINIHADYKLISYYPFYGLIIFIHPYGTPHHLTTHTDSIGLQTGMYTAVDIGLTEVN